MARKDRSVCFLSILSYVKELFYSSKEALLNLHFLNKIITIMMK